ncbi:MAG: TonB-dependent receptor [Fusobacterium sp.]|nr:TonB-dependent receptor [Fusobacterium sp.]
MKKIGLLAFLLSTALFAQENQAKVEKNQVKLDESVITAENFETTVRNTAANVTVVTADDIAKSGAKDLVQALQSVPGIAVKRYAGTIKFDMRGTNSMYSDKNNLVTLDGVPATSKQVSNLPIESIARVEVIPGGGNILYGDKSIGGVVNVLTKSVEDKKVYGNVSGEIGNNKYHKENITVGSRLTDKLIAEVGFTNSRPMVWRTGEKAKEQEGRFKVKYLLDNGDVEFKYTHSENERKRGNALPKKWVEEHREETIIHTASGKRKLFGGINKRDDFYLKYRQVFGKDLEVLAYGNYYHSKNSKYVYKLEEFKRNLDVYRKYGKFQLKKSYMTDNYFIVGADWLRNETKLYDSKKSVKNNLGIFVKNKINYDKFQFTQALRYDNAKYDFYWRDGSLTLPEKRGKKGSQKYGDVSLELSGMYSYSDTGIAYLSYNRAFRTPTLGEMKYTLNSQKLKAQVQDTFEIGVKDYIYDTYVSLATYYKKTNDELYSTIPPEFYGMVNYNVGDTRRIGVEAFAEHYFGDLTVNGGLTYINHKITKAANPIYKNSKIPSVPNWKLTAGVNYNVTPKFNVGADWLYYSKSFDLDDIANERGETCKGYSVFNLSANYKFENGLSLNAKVENILDEKYNEYEGYWSKSRQWYPAIGRNFSVGFNYKF